MSTNGLPFIAPSPNLKNVYSAISFRVKARYFNENTAFPLRVRPSL